MALEQGAVVGRYRITGLLGKGGMGDVYAGVDPNLNRLVAIKLISAEFAARSELVARALTEARATAAIGHHGIVQIFDVGTFEDRPYIVMEHLDGQDLGQRIAREGPLGEPELISVSLQIANALAAAHARGIVHRDLKPGNVHLLPSGTVKLLDFGVAKFQDRGSRNPSTTQSGVIMGTAAYMSPEQIRGTRDVDQRTDLYAFGCVIFEMASGRKPFDSGSFGELMVAHMTHEPPSLRELVPAIRPEIADIVAQLLQKDPEQRFQTAEAVADALRPLAPLVAPRLTPPLPMASLVEAARPSPGHTMLGDRTSDGLPRLVPTDARPPTMFGPPPSTAKTTVPIAAEQAPIEQLAGGLPSSMRAEAELLWDFLSPAFARLERLYPGLFSLGDVKLPEADANDYYLMVMEASQVMGANPDSGPRLDTTVFTSYAQPLEKRLESLPSPRRKVVVVVTDSQKLGEGVRDQIAHFRRRHNAVVVPVYILELANARRQRTLPHLFHDRLALLHSPANPFGSTVAATDMTRFFGMRSALTDVLAVLKKQPGFVVVCGPPGSGKTSLINVVNLELCRIFRFCRIRYAGYTDRVRIEHALIDAILASGDVPVERAATDTLGSVLKHAAREAATRKEQLALALDDCDWLIRQLIRPEVSDAERTAVRELWTLLHRAAETHGVRIIVSGLRGFLLKERTVGGWENPLAADTWICQVPNLDLPAVTRLVRELGTEGDIRFSDEAIAAIAQQTGGQVDLVLKVCSYAVRDLRKQSSTNVLTEAHLSAEDVKRAAADLVEMATTFSSNFVPLLAREECDVLRVVAGSRPVSTRAVHRQLAERWRPEEATRALESLRQMGLVERRDGRERLNVPMLERWALKQLDDPASPMVLDRRVQLAGIGLGATALLLVIYMGFIRAGTAVTESFPKGACRYSLQYPRRAAQGAEVVLYWRRECPASPPAAGTTFEPPVSGLRMVSAHGTVLRFGSITGETAPEQHCILSRQGGCVGPEIEIPTRLLESATPEFGLEIKDGDLTRTILSISRDSMAGMKELVDGTFKLVAPLPAALCLLAAFFRDIQKGLRRLLGLSPGAHRTVRPGRSA